MLAVFFLPLAVPPKDKSHVAPVHDVVLVQRADDCTTERLGDGVTPDRCRATVGGATVIVSFRYDRAPCGGDHCTTANDIRYAIEPASPQLLWETPHDDATGVHSFTVVATTAHPVCVTIEAVRLPENARSAGDHTCIRLTRGPLVVGRPTPAAVGTAAPAL